MAEEHVIAIGARLRARREELHLSQGAVARQLPGTVDGNQVSRWERGVHKPSDETLEHLAKALETEVATFYVDPPPERAAPDLMGTLNGNGGDPVPALQAQLTRIETMLADLLSRVPAPPEDPEAETGRALEDAAAELEEAPSEPEAEEPGDETGEEAG